MELISSRPLWPSLSRPPRRYPPLEGDLACDVAVVGAGVTGALVALELVRAGLDVVVLDRGEPAASSTAASTGLLLYELDVPLRRLSAMHGLDSALRVYRAGLRALATIGRLVRETRDDCGFAWRTSLQGATRVRDVSGLHRECALRNAHGFDAELWDGRRLRQVSSLPWPAALVTAEAAEIDPHRFTRAILSEAVRRGGRIRARTEVIRRETKRRGVELHTARGPRIRARHVVLATGYDAPPLSKRPFTSLHSTYAIAGRPAGKRPGWPGRHLLWDTGRPYCYLRTTPDGRAIIGGADIPFKNARLRDLLLPLKSRVLGRRLHRLFPEMAFAIDYAWAGTFAVTRDGLPYIGSVPGSPQVHYALGYGGNGMTFSVTAAEIIRDACLGAVHPDAELYRFDRG